MFQISARSIVADSIFRKVQGKTCLWFVPLIDNPEEWLFAYDPNDTAGMGGRLIEFTLENGTTWAVHGPWHSDAKAFVKDTGITTIGE